MGRTILQSIPKSVPLPRGSNLDRAGRRGAARIARDAYRDFGRGSGHPAALNFGDCFAYVLARARGEPLLFKSDDFTHTDVEPVL